MTKIKILVEKNRCDYIATSFDYFGSVARRMGNKAVALDRCKASTLRILMLPEEDVEFVINDITESQ